MEYEVGGPKVSVQTVYGVEVEFSWTIGITCSKHRRRLPNFSLCDAHVYNKILI
ncbi:hypothetical protein CsatB_029108 [Cannabis sativa]